MEAALLICFNPLDGLYELFIDGKFLWGMSTFEEVLGSLELI